MKLVYDEFLKKVEQSDCKKLISLRQRGKIMELRVGEKRICFENGTVCIALSDIRNNLPLETIDLLMSLERGQFLIKWVDLKGRLFKKVIQGQFQILGPVKVLIWLWNEDASYLFYYNFQLDNPLIQIYADSEARVQSSWAIYELLKTYEICGKWENMAWISHTGDF